MYYCATNYVIFMHLEGIITEIFPVQEKANLTVKKFVLKTAETYPQEVLVETINNKVALLQDHNVGDRVKVYINIKGRARTAEGITKYYNSIEAYKIESDF